MAAEGANRRYLPRADLGSGVGFMLVDWIKCVGNALSNSLERGKQLNGRCTEAEAKAVLYTDCCQEPR